MTLRLLTLCDLRLLMLLVICGFLDEYMQDVICFSYVVVGY